MKSEEQIRARKNEILMGLIEATEEYESLSSRSKLRYDEGMALWRKELDFLNWILDEA